MLTVSVGTISVPHPQVCQTTDEGFILAGTSNSFGIGDMGLAWVFKSDRFGFIFQENKQIQILVLMG